MKVFLLLAAIATLNQLGVLRVDSGHPRTIVSIPWVEFGKTADSAISVANLVLSENLQAGDQLYYWNGSTYQGFALDASKTWQGIQTVLTQADNTQSSVPAPTDDLTLSRGQALVLLRSNPAACFYLVGQVPIASSQKTVIHGGNTQSGVYNLVAPPTSGLFDVNTSLSVAGDCSADVISFDVGGGKILHCYRKDGQWKYWRQTTDNLGITSGAWALAPIIGGTEAGDDNPALGSGFWYIRFNKSDTILTWN